ncbi:ABC transporter permease [Acrocarpospora pleiomorpha]|uniref:ABC transporter permease n=2 Tax=Acrocarpospora pleiomorpha TaxID=90975 RepID=A0A5M3XSA9_9ACTN|nr:ABC transporter permease [Acrocarpospora pleiomorpha]
MGPASHESRRDAAGLAPLEDSRMDGVDGRTRMDSVAEKSMGNRVAEELTGNHVATAAGHGVESFSMSGTRAVVRLLRSEIGLTFRRPRNLALLAVLAVVPVLIGVAIRVAAGDGADFVGQVAGNGLVLAFAAFFVMVPLVLPLAVGVVAGDSIAGEASLGTLRYLLTAPAGRTRLLVLKYLNVVVFAVAACGLVAVSALVTGLLLFPVGPVTLLSGSTVPLAEGLLRIGLVALYAAAGMAALGALALAISTLTEAPIGAIAATLVLVVVAQVLQAIPQLAVIEPYLLTSWWNKFDGALRDPIAFDQMGQGLLAFGAYILVFGSIAWARFTSRDITA